VKRWRWITETAVLAGHDEQLAEHGGKAGIRDLGLIKPALATVMSALLVLAVTAPAMADPRHDDREWRDHVVHARHWHHPPHPMMVEAAPVVYAPPAVVYAPPPPPPGISLIIPLNLR
jgi:hypothetical protein